jgi:hypothetical protein
MKAGQTLLYSWVAQGAPESEFYFDLHSETPPPDHQVIEYLQETGVRSDGALVAPTDGVHGWYWQNRSPNRVKVHLRISGFYELIPPGEKGNKAGITPVNKPRLQSKSNSDCRLNNGTVVKKTIAAALTFSATTFGVHTSP